MSGKAQSVTSAMSYYFESVHTWPHQRAFIVAFYFLFFFDTYDMLTSHDPYGDLTGLTKIPVLDYQDRSPALPQFFLLLASIGALVSVVTLLFSNAPWPGLFTAAAFNYYYWGNALDDFQHHYLLCVVLSILPWVYGGETPKHQRHALRFMYLIVGCVYLWTAVAKLDDQFPRILGFTSTRFVHSQVSLFSPWISWEHQFACIAVGVVCVELWLGFLLVAGNLRNRNVALSVALGSILLHLSFELFATLAIRVFSYYMILLMAMLLPPFPTPRLVLATFALAGLLIHAKFDREKEDQEIMAEKTSL